MRTGVKWLLAAILGLAVLIPAGTFVYIHFIEGDAPKRLTLDSSSRGDDTTATSTAAPQGAVAGTWRPTSASQFGYRVKEILFGQDNEAVGRTNEVTGSMTIDGTTVRTVELTVNMASVTSDQARRDNQYRGRIMDVATFPTSKFELSKPIQLPSVPSDSSTVTVKGTGKLSLRGTTRTVTVDLKARRSGANLQVNGTIPITFADWGIPNPSFGPVSTQDHGELEFLVVFAKSS